MKKSSMFGVVLGTVILFAVSVHLVYGQVEPYEEWNARYGYFGRELAYDIAVDTAGNVYVTGIIHYYDYGTVKYDTNGNQLWVARYDGPGRDYDLARAIAVDSAGNVYVTGLSYGMTYDYATIKYDTNGNQLWVARYDGPASSTDLAKAIAVDSAGNVYVTGESLGIGTHSDYATVAYNSSGNELWVARYDGPGSDGDYTRAIAVDSAGNVYVTGFSKGITTNWDYATIKYDTNGNQLWVARYDGPGSDWDDAKAIAVDSAGNVYVTGFSGHITSNDYATIKYDTNGNELWVAMYDGPGNDKDEANAIAVDSAGNVYVTGESFGIGTRNDYATVAYDSSGDQLWVARYDGPASVPYDWDVATAIAVDSAGNVYVTGESAGIGTGTDYATVAYNSSGDQLWAVRYDDATWGPYEEATAIAIGPLGNVYVTGRGGWDYVTVKYNTQINILIAKVENLIDTGVLTEPQGNGLIARLKEALKNLNKDKPNKKAACNKLQDFIKQVNSYIKSGKLNPVEGQDLIDHANEIINTLCG